MEGGLAAARGRGRRAGLLPHVDAAGSRREDQRALQERPLGGRGQVVSRELPLARSGRWHLTRGARELPRLPGTDRRSPRARARTPSRARRFASRSRASPTRSRRSDASAASPPPSTRSTRASTSGTCSTPGSATARCTRSRKHVVSPYSYRQVVENLDRMIRRVSSCSSRLLESSLRLTRRALLGVRGGRCAGGGRHLRARRPAGGVARARARARTLPPGAAPARRVVRRCRQRASRSSCRRCTTRW